MSRGTVLGLIIEIDGGKTTAALMDEKGFSKSREQGSLWLTHPETGRILPYAGEGNFKILEKRGNYYYTLLPAGAAGDAYEGLIKEHDIEEHEELEESLSLQEGIIASLTSTIQKRHRLMPAGSYTTHLFEKGTGKIKKKCGEEAIELILAENSEDLVFESADLIYHLMVLLEDQGLTMADVLAELQKRDG
ncbi:phosphoribosyl-ATP diphosphatase [Oceanispirochaeta sp. M1]|uniref:phosphoribosyl-ATP diphosphatase n=1 Tax=unclassified Oceanispirochaeta TaxID=2635722 RepID=UPI001C12D9D8|nr:phosphoribosyl-ATP diphosphatase [Oceanispirochaeta sp. M1]